MQKFKYTTDSTFHIGQMHVQHITPCQDYADAFVTKNQKQAFLVLSDGCSTGGQTDLGSRFLARRIYARAKQHLAAGHSAKQFLPVPFTARGLAFLGLKPRDVFATQLACCADQNGASISVYGDGIVAFLYRDGSLRLERLEWNDNTPFYPIYDTAVGRKIGLDQSFAAAHGSVGHPFTKTTVQISIDGLISVSVTPFTLEEGMLGSRFYVNRQELSTLKGIALFSDGVAQVMDKDCLHAPQSWINTVRECLAFRGAIGSFAKRRTRRAIQDWSTAGFVPQDDLSCAVLLIEDSTELSGLDPAHAE
jgi:hypothetical protein